MDSYGLNFLIFGPAVAAIAICFMPEQRAELIRRFSLLVALACAVVAIALFTQLPAAGATGLIAETNQHWIYFGDDVHGGLDIRFHTGIDGLSGALLALTGLLAPLSVACSFTAIKHRVREYYAWMMALTAAMFGVFAARDVLLFYVFFEFTLIPLYFLIGIWGGSDRRHAANMFFLYTFLGSVVTFAGILYLAIRGADVNQTRMISFDLALLSRTSLTVVEQSWLFLAFFCGFAIKVPFFPLHTWLPLAHTEAPTAGSVLLAGVLLKLGTYGFLRFTLPMTPDGAMHWATMMGWLAVAGVIYGALCSWVQRDVKKLVAYSSVSHLGFCMLGMFSMLPVGLSGSVLYMINHGISTGALFLIVGMIYERYHTREMDKLGGLARQMPIMTFFMVFFVLSSIGLPGLNGFVSEFTTLFAAFNSKVLGPSYGVLGATGILLGAIYMLYMAGKVLFGPLKEADHGPDLKDLPRDLSGREIAILVPLALSAILLGVYPRIVTDTLDGALQAQILTRIESTAAFQSLPDPQNNPAAVAAAPALFERDAAAAPPALAKGGR